MWTANLSLELYNEVEVLPGGYSYTYTWYLFFVSTFKRPILLNASMEQQYENHDLLPNRKHNYQRVPL